MRIVDADTARALDADAMRDPGLPGAVLMERAALGTVAAMRRHLPDRGAALEGSVLVLAGTGNNGGDGIAVARLLVCAGMHATVLLVGDEARRTPDAAAQLAFARRVGVDVIRGDDDTVRDALFAHDVWVDALTGIGARPPLRGPVADVLELAGAVRDVVRPRVVAIDLPSGTCASTGARDPRALDADLTVTYGVSRWAHWLPPAMAACGHVEVVDIGLVPATVAACPGADVLDRAAAAALVPPMARDTHKGRQGRVTVVAGSPTMPGAAVLCARAALAAGSGLVTLASCDAARAAMIAHAPEVMTRAEADLPDAADAWLVGPGLGTGADAARRFEGVLAARGAAPVVIDADGLTLLAATPRCFDAPTVLTPHPAELARLVGASTQDVVADLPAAARAAAERYGAVVIAKTAGALVCDAGRDTFVPPGSPGMATAGSGDVLAGLVAGLAARIDAGAAARAGAWLHARAGALAVRATAPEPLAASDLVAGIGAAFTELRGG